MSCDSACELRATTTTSTEHETERSRLPMVTEHTTEKQNAGGGGLWPVNAVYVRVLILDVCTAATGW